jgi:hypothetical protein
MISARNVTKLGATFGINQQCNRETRAAEQVYVGYDLTTHPSHPVVIDAWIGYESIAAVRLTTRQASELIGLLSKALVTQP